MIPELFAIGAAYGIGWGYLRLILPTIGPAVAAAAAFPVGVAVWALAAAAVIVSGLPYGAAVPFWLCLLGLGVANAVHAAPVTVRELVAGGGGLVAVGAAGALFHYLDLTVISPDGMFVLAIGRQIAQYGGITEWMKGVLASFAIFLSLTQTAATALNLEYLRSLLPLVMLSGLVLFVVFGHRAIRNGGGERRRASLALPVLGAALLATSYAFLWSGFFVKASPVYAAMLLLASASAFFAATEGDTRWLAITLPALLLTMLLRMEAALTTLPMLVVLMSTASIPWRARLSVVVPVSAAFTLWYAFVVIRSFAHGMFSVYQLTVMGALPGAFAAAVLALSWLRARKGPAGAERLTGAMPWIMYAVLVMFIVAYTLSHPDTAVGPLGAFLCNIATPANGVTFYWGAVLILLALAPFVTRPVDGERMFIGTAAGFVLVVVAIAVQTPWKYCGPVDSGNRILTQIMPVFLFYLVLRFGRVRIMTDHRRCAHRDAASR